MRDLTLRSDLAGRDRDEAVRRKIARAAFRSRAILLWEGLWPRLVPILAVVGVFLLASVFGAWAGMADWLRFAVLAGFGIAALASLLPLLGVRVPTEGAAFAKIERASQLPHRPVTGVVDGLATSDPDPTTRAIWQAHRARLLAEFGHVRTGLPSPGLARRDPYGLRFLLLLTLVVGFVFAGDNSLGRVADAFRGGTLTPGELASVRIDAWTVPPDYTGRPSVFLTGRFGPAEGSPIAVPEGTDVFIRVAGPAADQWLVTHTAGLGVANQIGAEPRLSEGPFEYQLTLHGDADIVVDGGNDRQMAWSFDVVQDEPPLIAITDGPAAAKGGGLRVGYVVDDDYGVIAAAAEMGLAAADSSARPLVAAPEYHLSIPREGSVDAEAVTVRDLTEHPWSGLEVDFALVAIDAADQRGVSATHRIRLPARMFVDPIASALVEQRQILAIDARRVGDVAAAIDRLTDPATSSEIGLGAYLAVRLAYHRLGHALSDEDMLWVVDYLWDVAIAIEGDTLADAATALQAAADALRDALEAGADSEEIAELTDRLREAMQDYMQAIAGTPPAPTEMAVNLDRSVVGAEQLNGMLDQMQALAEAGDIDAAERLLEQLEQMMQNLDAGAFDGLEQEVQAGVEMLEAIGELMMEQQSLMDRTFGLRQQQSQPLPTPRSEEEADQLLEQLRQMGVEQEQLGAELREEQRQLRTTLQDIINGMVGDELDLDALPQAESNMGEAIGQLGEGQPGLAVESQSEVIEQLMSAAEALAAQIAEAEQRRGGGQGNIEIGGGAQDPLGRDIDGQRFGDGAVEIPAEIDRQLAREIIELIRQRLGDRNRPTLELDYLERLLGPF